MSNYPYVREPRVDPPDDDNEQWCPICSCIIDECEQPEEQGYEPDTGLNYAEAHEWYWIPRDVYEEQRMMEMKSEWRGEDEREDAR